MANYLWTFVDTPVGLTNSIGLDKITTDTVALPEIRPVNAIANSASTLANTAQTLVDVVRDYYWTYSKLDQGRQEVPAIYLTERKLRTNALISQLKYSLGQTTDGIDTTLSNLETYTTNPTIKSFIAGTKTVYDTAVGDLTNYLSTNLPNFQNDQNPTVNSSQWLKPYRNLYLTDPTNWIYKLPYFDNNVATQSNSFADSGNVGGAGNMLQSLPIPKLGNVNATGLVTEAAEVASSVSSLNQLTQITYIERTKFYNYPAEGEDINIEFPLINTGEVTYDDVVRNWQLLFLLLYQNRPGKTGTNTVDQPVIYQVEIPGIKYFPFCYVSSIVIDFVGSRREMKITIPTSNSFSSPAGDAGQYLGSTADSTSITAIIPDAYRVRISLRSMTANSKNFMQHMISNHNVVEAGTVSPINNLVAGAAAASPIYAAQHPLASYGVL
jgi:hypothetical protein